MGKRMKRVYVDASAIGGKFNRRLVEQTQPFWDAVERGEVIVIVSNVLEEEVRNCKEITCATSESSHSNYFVQFGVKYP